ncbi:hypothetical protein G3A43_06790 [Paraburkholderia aspalathi]|nr:hypothetical protein [Paraburkholderia aspalathi]MBK3779957.1 hypothetical protein [Paraburkholderia aspalathi]
MSTIKPKRPEYQEQEPTNRRVYFAAVDVVKHLAGGVSAVPGMVGSLLLGLFGFSTRWIGFIVWAFILLCIYEATQHVTPAARPAGVPAAQTAPGATHPALHTQ